MNDEDALELAWLRFAYDGMYSALGPADSEIVRMLRDEYVSLGGVLPRDEDDDDGQGDDIIDDSPLDLDPSIE